MPQIDIYPAPENRSFVEAIARLVSKNGLELERTLMSIDTNYNGNNYRFLCKSDPCHAFYQQKLNEYLKAKNQDTRDCCVPDDDDEEEIDLPWPPPYRYLSFHCPKFDFITIKELGIIKLTAQFVVRYDMYFHMALRKRVVMNRQFGFMQLADRRYKFYRGLVDAYYRVLRPCK
ncbi:putative splicing factor 3A subunit 1 [Cardamine amara subsp. amara]|uniref:Splicing factor 3A subunit 1 n=1 Tax=Cardamine amara subsp. amara TaxID=228776 RepID=A0ABD1AR55_CARAN